MQSSLESKKKKKRENNYAGWQSSGPSEGWGKPGTRKKNLKTCRTVEVGGAQIKQKTPHLRQPRSFSKEMKKKGGVAKNAWGETWRQK